VHAAVFLARGPCSSGKPSKPSAWRSARRWSWRCWRGAPAPRRLEGRLVEVVDDVLRDVLLRARALVETRTDVLGEALVLAGAERGLAGCLAIGGRCGNTLHRRSCSTPRALTPASERNDASLSIGRASPILASRGDPRAALRRRLTDEMQPQQTPRRRSGGRPDEDRDRRRGRIRARRRASAAPRARDRHLRGQRYAGGHTNTIRVDTAHQDTSRGYGLHRDERPQLPQLHASARPPRRRAAAHAQ